MSFSDTLAWLVLAISLALARPQLDVGREAGNGMCSTVDDPFTRAADNQSGNLLRPRQAQRSLLQVRSRAGDLALPAFWTENLFDLAGPPSPPHKANFRTHAISLLKHDRSWMFMGVVVASMAMLIVRLELVRSEPSAVLEPAPCQGSPDLVPSGAAPSAWPLLLLCFVVLQLSMLLNGIAMEFVMTRTYKDASGKPETIITAFVLFWNRIAQIPFFGFVMALRGDITITKGFYWVTTASAMTRLGASWCQYESLLYVTFAVQTTAKTVKLLPVVVMNSLRGKPQTVTDYLEAVTMAAAMFVFCLETQRSEGASVAASAMGILLLMGLVLLDSATLHLQDIAFEKNASLSSVHVMFAMACVSCAVLLVVLMASASLFSSIGLLLHNPQAMLHLTVLAVSAAVFQYFITYTVQHFGPIALAFIVSFRQTLAVFVSAALFQHHLSGLAIIAILTAFVVLIAHAWRKPPEFTRKP